MTSKFRIKLGQIELDFEGNEEFLKKELPELLAAVSKLFQQAGTAALSTSPGGTNAVLPQATTGSIAGKLRVTSGPELIIAAAAHLSLVKGMPTFTRDQVLKEMQSAPTFYKKTYLNNLTAYLGRLVKTQKLREVSKDTYSLSEADQATLRGQLA